MLLLVKIPKCFEVLENVTFLIIFLPFTLAFEKEGGGGKERGGRSSTELQNNHCICVKAAFWGYNNDHITDFKKAFHSSL